MDFKKWLKYISYITLGVNSGALIIYLISIFGGTAIKQVNSIIFLVTVIINFILIYSNIEFQTKTIVDIEKWLKLITWSFMTIIFLSAILIIGTQFLYLLANEPVYNMSINFIITLNITAFIIIYSLGIAAPIYNIKVMDQIETWIE
ncbi:MAG: hypothetical protein ACTSPY_05985 [Candidatus Helarchaeota archaeon]